MDGSDRSFTAKSSDTAEGGSKERSRAPEGTAGKRRQAKEHGGAAPDKKRHSVRTRKDAGGRDRGRKRGRGSRPGRSGSGLRGQKQGGRRQSLAASFGHAFEGIRAGVLEERNMKIHCAAAVLVILFGLLLHISVTEWCICFALFGLIMGLELVNTAIEAVVDLATQDFHPLAKRAKDTAAGAVLIASIMAAAAGLIIFLPRLLYFFHSLF